MNTFGYVRVSSQEQNEDRQMIAMREFGVPDKNIFLDKQSGKDFNRPQYQKMAGTVREGDLLVIKSIDRLGRNYHEVREQWRILTKEKKIDICVIDMPLLDTRGFKNLEGTFIADLVLLILGYVSECERNLIRQRQREGIDAAKARGVHFGRTAIEIPACFPKVVKDWKAGLIPFSEALAQCQMTPATFYRRLKEIN